MLSPTRAGFVRVPERIAVPMGRELCPGCGTVQRTVRWSLIHPESPDVFVAHSLDPKDRSRYPTYCPGRQTSQLSLAMFVQAEKKKKLKQLLE